MSWKENCFIRASVVGDRIKKINLFVKDYFYYFYLLFTFQKIRRIIQTMKTKIPFLLFIVLTISCGGGGESPPAYEAVGNPRIEGDSMAAGIEYSEADKMAKIAYDWRETFPGAQIRGVSGARLSFIAAIIDTRPTPVIILFAGFNDLKHAEKPLADIAAEYRALVASLPGRVVCVGVPLMDHSKSDGWFPAGAGIDNDRIQGFNGLIRKICGDYIDTPGILDSGDTSDGVHPNRAGYEKIALAIKSAITPLFP
jgi:lysophospholipase L1-like esterase